MIAWMAGAVFVMGMYIMIVGMAEAKERATKLGIAMWIAGMIIGWIVGG